MMAAESTDTSTKPIGWGTKILIGTLWSLPLVSVACFVIAAAQSIVYAKGASDRLVRVLTLFVIYMATAYGFGYLTVFLSSLLPGNSGLIPSIVLGIILGFLMFRYLIAPLLYPIYSNFEARRWQHSWRSMPFLRKHVKGVLGKP